MGWSGRWRARRRARHGGGGIALYAAPVLERSDVAEDGGADDVIDVRGAAPAPARTGDELEDALTDELGRITGQVPVIDLAALPQLGG